MRPGLPALLALLALAGPAQAQQRVTAVAPSDGAEVARDEPVRFEVATDPAVTSVSVRVTSGSRVLAEGPLRRDGDAWTGELRLDRPGTYRWRAEARRPDFRERTPARTFAVLAPSGGETAPIPRRFGRRRNRASFLVSTRDIPASVGRGRFGRLVRATAPRWGLRMRGWTSRRAGRGDGVHVVGFARRLPRDDALAAVRVVHRVTTRDGRVVDRRVHDRDMLVRRRAPWWRGPALPRADRLDLETVLLHEFGHFAGNARHASRCSGSPMTESAGRGEWWRTPRNWWQAGCRST